MSQPTRDGRDPFTAPGIRQWVGFTIVVCCFWASLYVYIPTLAVYATSIGASLTMVGLMIGSYGFVQFLLRIPTGYLSDRLGKRVPFILVGLAANAAGAAGMALLASPWMLVLWRGVHGIGAASYVTSSVYFAAFFRPENATRAAGLMVAITSGTQVAVSLLGGMLAESYGVVTTFWAAAVFGVVGLLVMAVTGERRTKKHTPISLGRFARVITVPQLLIVAGLAAVNQYLTFALTMGFVPVLADRLGASNTDLGVLTTIGFGSYTVSALLAAWTVSRIGERRLVVAGSAATALTSLALPLVANIPQLYVAQALNGLGRGVVFPVLMGLAITSVPENERASAMGVFQAIYAIGMFAGPATAGAIAEVVGLSGLFVFVGALGLAGALVAAATIRDVGALKLSR